MSKTAAARIRLIASMVIFGTMGIFARGIALPSSLVANARGVIGSVFLLLAMRAKGERFSGEALRRNLWPLCASGAALGINWVLLFEAYKHTTVAKASLCYYVAPLIVVALSPLLFRERLTWRKGLCVAAAMLGMVFVSGLLGGGLPGGSDEQGIALGLCAAAMYALIVILNKRISGVTASERTVVQLAISAVVLLPYNLLTVDFSALSLTPGALGLLLILGVVHTGIVYRLYFGSMEALPAQSVALLSYIDPAVAVLVSALVLGEPLTLNVAAGAVLILGAAMVSELGGQPGTEND